MVKRLSDQLSDLSVRAKNLETAVIAAQKEGQDKLVSRTAEARASATAAVDKVKQAIKAAGDAGSTKWGAMEAKLGADRDALKTRVVEKKRAIDATIAEHEAADAEDDASFAIDYAIASIEQAKLAAFDADLRPPRRRGREGGAKDDGVAPHTTAGLNAGHRLKAAGR